VGDGSVDARQQALGRVRRRLVWAPEGRLQSHAHQRRRQCQLAEGSVAEEVAAALTATDKDIAIGGAGLAAAAIELGLVDELRMFRNPIVVGDGRPFLPPVTDNVLLELVETRTFGSRVIFERYGRTGDEPLS
jgi:dihydrofolate reductase